MATRLLEDLRAAPPGPDLDGSDADSDLEELEGDIARFDQNVRDFLASHRGPGTAPGFPQAAAPTATRGGRSSRRGPRAAAKPRGDITARLAKVNKAFLTGDYENALLLASEVIRINAETHPAWTALASIFAEMGEADKSLSAMVYAAHLRSKEVGGWLRCADFAMEIVDGHRDETKLETARLCYAAALRAEPINLDARLGKANVCHRLGRLATAVNDYSNILKQRPHDLDIVRKLAEACIDSGHSSTAVDSATEAYQRYFDHERAQGPSGSVNSLWHDVGIYVDLYASHGRYLDSIRELRSLSRWLLGRASETYWDEHMLDDREWDGDDLRRGLVPQYQAEAADASLYGGALPLDLRARLATCRLSLDNEREALKHLAWLDPTEHHTREFVQDFPFLVLDIASALSKRGQAALAAKYLEVLREVSGEPDAAVLLLLGRCYFASKQQSAAEECFLDSIQVDPYSVDARIELANMYEQASEGEEALILAAEALALRGAQRRPEEEESAPRQKRAPRSKAPRRPRSKEEDENGEPKRRAPRGPVVPRRYRPKRLGAVADRHQDEQAHAVKLSEQYQAVRELRSRIKEGQHDLVEDWMQSSRELVDDFRSLKQFYSWDKYLQLLGSKKSFQQMAPDQPGNALFQMYERLTRTLIPVTDHSGRHSRASAFGGHQGISFDEWLQIFLDFAIGLAIAGRKDECYQVCEAARDSTVFQHADYNFQIHVAWSVCAVYLSDEEMTISVARHLMKDGVTSDASRMFAFLSYVCQSPIIWYTSGPVQKYIMRQIRQVDNEQLAAVSAKTGMSEAKANEADLEDVTLDACILTLYGHILFASTSYTYALGYFLRARALDPNNPMINLSLGLSYVHYALKRQAVNRQFLILQGLAFLSNYIEVSQQSGHGPSAAEMYYNIGRLHHLLGISSLAMKYYNQALASADGSSHGQMDIRIMSTTNQIVSLLALGDHETALKVLKGNQIVL